ncbi:DUF4241 domain-containing protein [Ancylobacter rudongensis]|uniref:Uncharacterized protein n=1 Tax=Ancylobacter rudongensis TaxID=177413 RepID=A0A1G4UNW7_9HYPH|nr:DUF4241 domain-containing protein [Ancylobacter rudongensis]SCW95361.1 hypothetical protein SAMN05660859_0008 [Ancylobacter rudongensis]
MSDPKAPVAHPTLPGFIEMGHVDVDAGSIWIGDGCYVLKDADEKRPTDLGEDWHGICERFFGRSGYRHQQIEWSRWSGARERDLFDSPEWKAWVEKWGLRHPDTHKSDTICYAEKHEAMQRHYERYSAEHPFQPTSVDTGFAQFNHDLGHAGMGVMVSTFYGDGTYPVYVEYGEGGRPRRVLIDFDPGAENELVRGSPADIFRVLSSHYPELASGDRNIAPMCRKISDIGFPDLSAEAA